MQSCFNVAHVHMALHSHNQRNTNDANTYSALLSRYVTTEVTVKKGMGSVCTCLEDIQLIKETKNRVTTESDDVTTEIVSKSSVMTKNI